MKTRTETSVIPAEEYRQTYLGCDHCDLEVLQDGNDAEAEVKRHIAANHCVADRRTVDGKTFLRFDNEFALESYKDGHGGREPTYGAFTTAGWYQETYESGPCGRGCCSREWYQLTDSETVVAALTSTAMHHARALQVVVEAFPDVTLPVPPHEVPDHRK